MNSFYQVGGINSKQATCWQSDLLTKVLPVHSWEVFQLTPLLPQCTCKLKQQYCTDVCPMHPEKLANELHSPHAHELHSYKFTCHTTTC